MSCILGNTFIRIVMPETFQGTTKMDVYFVTGLMILNVYAQIYSVFAGVGRLAFSMALVVVVLLSIRYLIKGIREGAPRRFSNVQPAIWKICISIILAGIILILTMKAPEFVDTYLYHVQAIRWIEEYGVVPGLGNLHCRFAYNSAFLVLRGTTLNTYSSFSSCIVLY